MEALTENKKETEAHKT